MPTRRAILKTGAASALVLGAGTTGYAWYPGSSAARAPWSHAGESFGDARIDATSLCDPRAEPAQPPALVV